MTDRPFISVVIPAYNTASFLAQALDSALAQEGPEFEVIVADDGSTDDTPGLLKAYGERIRIFRQEHQGVIAARNLGIAQVRGAWVAFLDGDDRWLPGHLQRAGEAIAAHPEAGLFYSDVRIIDEKGKLLKINHVPEPGPDPFRTLLLRNVVPTSTAVVSKAGLEEAGPFYTGLKADSEDWDMWLRIVSRHPIFHLGEARADYRRHRGGIIHQRAQDLRGDGLEVLRRALLYGPPQPSSVARAAFANCYLESAVRFLTGGHAASARADLLDALRQRPGLFKVWPLLALSLLGDTGSRRVVELKRRLTG